MFPAAVSPIDMSVPHRPNELPEELLERLVVLATDDCEEVRTSAAASLSSLAQLGSRSAALSIKDLGSNQEKSSWG